MLPFLSIHILVYMIRLRQNCVHDDEKHALSYPVVSLERVDWWQSWANSAGILEGDGTAFWGGTNALLGLKGIAPGKYNMCVPNHNVVHVVGGQQGWPSGGDQVSGRQVDGSMQVSCLAVSEKHVGKCSSSEWGLVTGYQLWGRSEVRGKEEVGKMLPSPRVSWGGH